MTELIRDFLDPAEFFRALKNVGNIDFFCGVPDSLLKDFCAYITTHVKKENHIITANEGSAIGLAAGYHLATGKTPMVYLQNSGLGNTVNPLLSLAAPSVYSVPILLLVGWRGEPGKRDEPQHLVQGQSTPGILASLNIPFQILPDYEEGAEQVLATAKQYMDNAKAPYCLLVKRQTFLPFKLEKKPPQYKLNREQVLNLVVNQLNNRDIVISTTGMLSRELFEYRANHKQGHERDFLTVGSMGHATAIAAGVAIFKTSRQVFCLDGDGASIMHMGNMATIGQNGTENLKHIIFNNAVHDSVGAQPTDAAGENFSFTKIALGCGYKEAISVHEEKDIIAAVKHLRDAKGPCLLEIKCNSGHRKDLGRPTRKPVENKSDFMHFLAIN
jgi:phosphonopyruvate decarboxylase